MFNNISEAQTTTMPEVNTLRTAQMEWEIGADIKGIYIILDVTVF